jgi:hypothetical protein
MMRHHAFGDDLTVRVFAELDQVVLVLRWAISCRVAPPDERARWQDQVDQAVDQLSIGLIQLLVEAPRG